MKQWNLCKPWHTNQFYIVITVWLIVKLSLNKDVFIIITIIIIIIITIMQF